MNSKKSYVCPKSSALDYYFEGAIAISQGSGSSENNPSNPAINNEVGNGVWGTSRKGLWNVSGQSES